MVTQDKTRLRMKEFEIVGIKSIVENMVEFHLRVFEYAWRRRIKSPIKKVDQIKNSPRIRGRWKRRKLYDT